MNLIYDTHHYHTYDPCVGHLWRSAPPGLYVLPRLLTKTLLTCACMYACPAACWRVDGLLTSINQEMSGWTQSSAWRAAAVGYGGGQTGRLRYVQNPRRWGTLSFFAFFLSFFLGDPIFRREGTAQNVQVSRQQRQYQQTNAATGVHVRQGRVCPVYILLK